MARFPESCVALPGGERLVLRSMMPEDHAAYVIFQRQVAEETTHTLQIPGRIANYETVCARWTAALDAAAVESCLGVFDGVRLIGMLLLHSEFGDHPWTRHAGLFGMMILRAYWGRGLGTYMLQCLDAQARQCGLTRLGARVRVKNERGVALYQRTGYTIEGVCRCAAYIHGQYVDEYYIAKLFIEEAGLTGRTPSF